MRLLSLTSEDIKSLMDDMEKEVTDIKSSALKLSWYMRGAVSYTDIMNMSMNERKLISEIAKDNIETTKKSGIALM
jgi:hypothetical protein